MKILAFFDASESRAGKGPRSATSQSSMKALDQIKGLKAAGAEEVIALHVIDDRTLIEAGYVSSIRGQLEEQSKKDMEALAGGLEGLGLKTQTHVRVGVPFKEILDMEKEVSDFFSRRQ